jgi:hypothetical protein
MIAPMWADLPHHMFRTVPLADSMASPSNDSAGTQFLLQPEYENEAYVEKSLHRQLHRLQFGQYALATFTKPPQHPRVNQ